MKYIKEKVARSLRAQGAKVSLSPGSKGAADLTAEFPTKTWKVQVKASEGDAPASKEWRDVADLLRAGRCLPLHKLEQLKRAFVEHDFNKAIVFVDRVINAHKYLPKK